jgi:hypothetical protein
MIDKNRCTWKQDPPLLAQLLARLDALEKRLAALENPVQPKGKSK